MELTSEMVETLLLTLKLASLTTLILFAAGIPIAYWIAYSPNRLRPFAETLISMPLVLPPTVLGFYFLIAFNPSGAVGGALASLFDLRLVFSFSGLVVASVIYSLPFMVQPLQSGFRSIPRSLAEASATLGKTPLQTLLRVLLPGMKPALLTGIVLSFAHTIGEFGIVLMIGGNIPGATRVASIAIYDEVAVLHYAAANTYALILIGVTFCMLLPVYWKRTADDLSRKSR